MADAVNAQLARMRKLARSMSSDFLPAVAQEVEREITREVDRQLAEGRAPDGTKWPPRKRDGGRALENARAHVRVDAIGNVIRVRLKGDRPTVLHHYGYARGAPRRQIVPDKGERMPDSWARAIDRAIARVAKRFGLA